MSNKTRSTPRQQLLMISARQANESLADLENSRFGEDSIRLDVVMPDEISKIAMASLISELEKQEQNDVKILSLLRDTDALIKIVLPILKAVI